MDVLLIDINGKGRLAVQSYNLSIISATQRANKTEL